MAVEMVSAGLQQLSEGVLAPFLRIQWARRATVALIYLGLWCVSFYLALTPPIQRFGG